MNQLEFEKVEKQILKIGNEMYQLMIELFPICRSITGNGVRQTLKKISRYIPLEIHEVPSGTKVFDWIIPQEWNINDAYVIDPDGKRIIDFKKSNLHIVSYSIPIHKTVSLNELKKHIHTLPEQPDIIPYRTSYYKEYWGFCMSHNEFLKLKYGEYEVVIDSSLKDGSLTYGEYYIKGKKEDEILISCYVCHPSMCNDNLSGIVLTTMIAKYLSDFSNNYSMRFLFIPETIGAITWLSLNENNVSKIKHGLVATCVGDSRKFTYKKSRQGDAEIDKTVIEVLKKSNTKHQILDFFPTGSDERQFCSPAFNLPVGSLFRSLYGTSEFPEYHTSADNLQFVKKTSLAESLLIYLKTVLMLETNHGSQNQQLEQLSKTATKTDSSKTYLNLNPKCEPYLSKRELYTSIGGQIPNQEEQNVLQRAILWVLNYSDGHNSLVDISKKSGLPFTVIENAANILCHNNLLKEVKLDA